MDSSLERALAERKARRESKVAPSRLTPSMISYFAPDSDADGILCRHMFSGKGTIKRVVLSGTPVEKTAKVEVELATPLDSTTTSLNVSTQLRVADVSLAVDVGTKVTVRVVEGGLTNVSIGVLWMPSGSETDYA